jgi:hypothetical protein
VREREGKKKQRYWGEREYSVERKSSLDQSATRIREPNTKPERGI